METSKVGNRKGNQTYLIIDQGSHGTRAAVMDGNGFPLSWSHRPLAVTRPRDGYVEHDPEELILTAVQCVKEVSQKIGTDVGKLSSAGFATQRSSIVCWDHNSGKALSPVISWQDTRGEDSIKTMSEMAGEIHDRTGLFLSSHYGASKLAWCIENLPPVKKALSEERLCFGPMSSFLTWRLTGEKRFVTDPVNASRTLLYNIHTDSWDPQLLQLFRVPVNSLPACVSNTYRYGHLDAGGCPVPLMLVTGDQSAAVYAHGQLQPETCYVNMGTGAFLFRKLGSEVTMSERLLTSVLYKQECEGEYALEGTVNGAGSAIKWIQDSCSLKDLWGLLPHWLAEPADPPLFLNGISGLGSPYWLPEFKAEFVGEGSDREKVVAVLESVVFLIYRNMVEMNRYVAGPERIQVTGGLSFLDGACQRISDLSGLPVYRPAQVEATARGTCYFLAGKPDNWPEPAPGKWFLPDLGNSLEVRYARWLGEMENKVERWHKNRATGP